MNPADLHNADKNLDEVVVAYLEAVEAGETPDRTDWLSRYPHLASQLSEFFADQDRFGRLAAPLREAVSAIQESTIAEKLAEEGRPSDFRLLREIGRGGMGIVYEAEQISLGRRVALKVLPFASTLDAKQLQRFKNEAQAAAQLHHTNIVPVHATGCERGVHYYAMQFIHGRSLDVVLKELRRLRSANPSPPPSPNRGGAEGEVEPPDELTVALARGLLTGEFQTHELPTHDNQDSTIADSRSTTPLPTDGESKTEDRGSRIEEKPSLAEDCRSSTLIRSSSHDESPSSYFRRVATIGLQVAQGLSYAHSQAVLHRDIKPSNLLLDTRGTVWITDFGLAKVEGSDELTKPGDILGTLRYMAPERFEGRADARGDLYSLGTTLYELLTLHPTFEDSNRARLIERIAHEQPLRPRRLDPHTPRDLETIVLKAIAKEPADRFQTAAELAAELERFLADRPIKTHRSSAVEHVWRWCRRNPQIAALAAAVVLALVAGIAGTTWGMIRAQKRLAQLEKATDILASVFRDLDPQAAEKEGTTMHDLLARRLVEAARQLEGEAVGDPLVVARIQHALGISLRDLCYLEQAEAVLVKACQTRERLLGADHLDTAATKHDLAMVYRAYGKYALDETKYPLAETLYKEALAVRTAKLGADHPDTLSTRHHLAILYYSQEKYAVAETLHKQVLAARTARLGAHNPDTLTSQHWLGLVYRFWGNYAQAETLYKEVLAARIAKLGPDHLDTVATKGDLARLYLDQGKYAQAETMCQEVLAVRTAKLGPRHPDTLNSQHHLALVYHSQGKYSLAETLIKQVLAIRTARLGADHPVTLDSKHYLAALYQAQEKYAMAETLYKEVIALRTAKLGADHPDTQYGKIDLAKMYRFMKKLDQSIPLLEEMIKLRKAKIDADRPDLVTLETEAELALNYADAGRFTEAISLFEEVHAKGSTYSRLAWVGDALLITYLRAGKDAEAIALAREQVRAARKEFAADSPQLAAVLATAGETLLDTKAYADAEPLLRECLAIRQSKEVDAWTRFDTQSLLGAALLGQKKYAEAESLLVQGYAGMKSREDKIPKDFVSFRLAQALERVVRLYEANGPKDKADEWRRKLADQKKKESEVKSQEAKEKPKAP